MACSQILTGAHLPGVGVLHRRRGRKERDVWKNDDDVFVDRRRRQKLEALLGAVAHRRDGTGDVIKLVEPETQTQMLISLSLILLVGKR